MPRKQKKYHFLYKTTCKTTGKFYVGMHSSDSLEDGYLGSGKILGYSRHKYGDENHTREILEICESREQLKSREKEIVNEDMLKDPLNMNLKYGGEGGFTKESSSKGARNRNKKYGLPLNLLKSRGFKNKKHSEKSLIQLKETFKKNKHAVGERNSQFGTIWLTNGIKNCKIKRNEEIPSGWYRGRIIKME